LTVLPAATAAVTTSVGHDDGLLVPKKIAASRVRPIASSSERLHLPPDVVTDVVENGFGDRDDRGDLLDVEVLVRPVDLGRLLQPGVTGDEVGDREGRQDGEPHLGAGNRDTGERLERCGLRLEPFQDRVRHLLRDEPSGVGAASEVVVGHGWLLDLSG
jgi:hypothetical protein